MNYNTEGLMEAILSINSNVKQNLQNARTAISSIQIPPDFGGATLKGSVSQISEIESMISSIAGQILNLIMQISNVGSQNISIVTRLQEFNLGSERALKEKYKIERERVLNKEDGYYYYVDYVLQDGKKIELERSRSAYRQGEYDPYEFRFTTDNDGTIKMIVYKNGQEQRKNS